jgi:hypothetical protein
MGRWCWWRNVQNGESESISRTENEMGVDSQWEQRKVMDGLREERDEREQAAKSIVAELSSVPACAIMAHRIRKTWPWLEEASDE